MHHSLHHTDVLFPILISVSVASVSHGVRLTGAFLIFLLVHTCGICLLGCGEPLTSTKFPFDHFSELILIPSSCGVKWRNLMGRRAWEQRGDFWGFCGNTAKPHKQIFWERSFADAQEGFLDIQGLPCYFLTCATSSKRFFMGRLRWTTLLWRANAGLRTAGKVDWLKN